MEPNSSRVLISSSRKPISYINVCKKYLQENGEVQLSALGVAISSAVTVCEILKSKDLCTEKKIETMLEVSQDEETNKTRQKPKLVITLAKSDKFDAIMAAEEATKSENAAAAASAAENAKDGDE